MSARNLTRTATAWHATLTVTMLAVCGLAWGEDQAATPPAADAKPADAQPAPAPAADATPAADGKPTPSGDQPSSASAEAAADFYYQRGMKAREQSRLDDAIHDLTIAVDWSPSNQTYRKALEQTQVLAGLHRDARATTIQQMADSVDALQQQLWIEAESEIEAGEKAMRDGDPTEAERQFSFAMTRLDVMPFADPRRAPEQRRVQSLLAMAKDRREQKDLQDAKNRNIDARTREEELRDANVQIERDRIDAMLMRAVKAKDRRDFDDAIMLCEQVLKINRAEERAHKLLISCQRARHIWLRQITADRWDEEHKLLSESIRASMLPQHELLLYPPDWYEIDARRSAPQQGLKESDDGWREAINKALDLPVSMDFHEADLVDVISFLQRNARINIVLDPKVSTATPPPGQVSLTVNNMKARDVLDFIMRQTGLTYTLRNEAIFISNAQGMRGDLILVPYDIRDLTHVMKNYPGPELGIPDAGTAGAKIVPAIDSDRTPPEIAEIIDIIQKVIAPDSWKADGGPTIVEYDGKMVVTQTADVQKQIAELLRSQRNQRGTQIHVKCKFLTIENSLLEEIGVDWQNFNNSNLTQYTNVLNGQGLLPAQNGNGNGGAQTFGAYGAGGAVIAAANVTTSGNALQSYDSTGHTLPSTNPGGLQFNTQYWRVAQNFYVSAILHAVEQTRRGNVTEEPDITIYNGQQANIVHINQQAYVSNYEINQGQYQPDVSTLAYGTVLDVVAIASADRKYITMTLKPATSSIDQWRNFGPPLNSSQFLTGAGTAGSNGSTFGGATVNQAGAAIGDTNPLLIPEITYQSVQTTVTIPDGGSLMLAGMSNGESARSHTGVPFLSHIPFLGRLFSTNGRDETELKTLIMIEADVVLFEEIERNL